VRLLLADARLLVESGLREESLSRVHVYCPDPWPKRRHAERRLFAPPFASHLARVLRPAGELLLTSDFDPYFREVAARLAARPEWVRTTTQPFAELPAGGFDAIFASEGIPVFRGCWQRRADSHAGEETPSTSAAPSRAGR